MTDIVWEEPPARGKYHDFASELRKNPGRWARLPKEKFNPSDSKQIRNGAFAAFRPTGSFEAEGSARHQATYVRYVGEAS